MQTAGVNQPAIIISVSILVFSILSSEPLPARAGGHP